MRQNPGCAAESDSVNQEVPQARAVCVLTVGLSLPCLRRSREDWRCLNVVARTNKVSPLSKDNELQRQTSLNRSNVLYKGTIILVPQVHKSTAIPNVNVLNWHPRRLKKAVHKTLRVLQAKVGNTPEKHHLCPGLLMIVDNLLKQCCYTACSRCLVCKCVVFCECRDFDLEISLISNWLAWAWGHKLSNLVWLFCCWNPFGCD